MAVAYFGTHPAAPPHMAASRLAEEEEEPFEIQDFSVATPWEQLVATIEQHLRAWAGAAGPPPPLELIAQLGVASPRPSTVQCVLSCHGSLAAERSSGLVADQPTLCEQLLRTERSLRSDAFSMALPDRLHRWYGVSSLVLLCPSDPPGSLDASEMAALQSALCTAAGACGCAAPLFVLHESSTAGVCGRAMAAVLGTPPRTAVGLPPAPASPGPVLTPASGRIATIPARVVCTRFDVKCFETVPGILWGDGALPALYHLFRSKVGIAGGACGAAAGAIAGAACGTAAVGAMDGACGAVGSIPTVAAAVRVTLVLDQWGDGHRRGKWGSNMRAEATAAAASGGGGEAGVEAGIPDPVALRPVLCLGAGVELPLTAWGGEVGPAGRNRHGGLASWGGRASWAGGGAAGGGGGLASLALACEWELQLPTTATDKPPSIEGGHGGGTGGSAINGGGSAAAPLSLCPPFSFPLSQAPAWRLRRMNLSAEEEGHHKSVLLGPRGLGLAAGVRWLLHGWAEAMAVISGMEGGGEVPGGGRTAAGRGQACVGGGGSGGGSGGHGIGPERGNGDVGSDGSSSSACACGSHPSAVSLLTRPRVSIRDLLSEIEAGVEMGAGTGAAHAAATIQRVISGDDTGGGQVAGNTWAAEAREARAGSGEGRGAGSRGGVASGAGAKLRTGNGPGGGCSDTEQTAAPGAPSIGNALPGAPFTPHSLLGRLFTACLGIHAATAAGMRAGPRPHPAALLLRLWLLLVDGARGAWEGRVLLPHLPSLSPSEAGGSMEQQRLLMINCCIRRVSGLDGQGRGEVKEVHREAPSPPPSTPQRGLAVSRPQHGLPSGRESSRPAPPPHPQPRTPSPPPPPLSPPPPPPPPMPPTESDGREQREGGPKQEVAKGDEWAGEEEEEVWDGWAGGEDGEDESLFAECKEPDGNEIPWGVQAARASGVEGPVERLRSEQRTPGCDPLPVAPSVPQAPHIDAAPAPQTPHLGTAPSSRNVDAVDAISRHQAPNISTAFRLQADGSAGDLPLDVGRRRRLVGMVGAESGAAIWEPFTQEGMPLIMDAMVGLGPMPVPYATAPGCVSPPRQGLGGHAASSAAVGARDPSLGLGAGCGAGPGAGVARPGDGAGRMVGAGRGVGSGPGVSRLWSAQLKSDMQAFKAANPGAVLFDFVRWRSPADVLEAGSAAEAVGEGREGAAAEEGKEGRVASATAGEGGGAEAPSGTEAGGVCAKATAGRNSTNLGAGQPSNLNPRVCAPGSLWVELWEGSPAVAASEQRPLFDPTREAHIALQELDTEGEGGELLTHLCLGGVAQVLTAMAESPHAQLVPGFGDRVLGLWRDARRLFADSSQAGSELRAGGATGGAASGTPGNGTGDNNSDDRGAGGIDEFCLRLADLESLLAAASVLCARLPGQNELVRALLGAPNQPRLAADPPPTPGPVKLNHQTHGAGPRSAQLGEGEPGDAGVPSGRVFGDGTPSDVEVSQAARASVGAALLRAAGERPEERTLREFVFTATAARAASRGSGIHAQPTAQRMYAGVRDDQWRLAFALSERGA